MDQAQGHPAVLWDGRAWLPRRIGETHRVLRASGSWNGLRLLTGAARDVERVHVRDRVAHLRDVARRVPLRVGRALVLERAAVAIGACKRKKKKTSS